MTPDQGKRRLRRLLGKTFHCRYNPRGPSREERALAREMGREVNEERRAVERDLADRRAELLEADAVYCELRDRLIALKAKGAALSGVQLSSRVQVGRILHGIAFHVDADADNWAEAVRIVERKIEAGEITP